jgi:mannose-6-phosphate isomerase-like protein (cupin superfamily)
MPSEYRIEKADGRFVNSAMMRQIMSSEGYNVFQWFDQPGKEYGPHVHMEDQSHWVISGTLELAVQGVGLITLEPGDRDFMPARTRHAARVKGDEPVMYLVGAKR